MDSAAQYWSAKAALDWQIEMGVDEAICDAPIDRYALQDKPKDVAKPAAAVAAATPVAPAKSPAKPADVDVVAKARAAAGAAQDLAALKAAMAAFEHCELKAGARNLVFSDGTQGAPVMIVTDAPDRADDRAGRLFSGPTGVLLDKMLGAIDMGRDRSVYAAPVVPWNPPQDRDPTLDELAMMLPFMQRHIALAAPKVLVLMGNAACQALLGRSGMTRMRGKWADVGGTPAVPIFAPGFLLANGAAKRDAWADLLALKAKVRELG